MTRNKGARGKFFFALIIFSLVGQIAWVVENMYLNVFIYRMFNASASQISFMVSASAVTATLTTLLIGALSDKLGRRKVFICAGYILWGVSILGFALVGTGTFLSLIPAGISVNALGVTLVIALDCLMTFFGSSANDACFNAWLTDVTTSRDRGSAEGINAMMPLIAILAVFGGFMGFDLSLSSSWTVIFCIIGGVVILMGCLGFFLISEPRISTEGNQNYFANILYGFRPKVIRENRMLYLLLIAFAIFGISIQIFMPYLILYYTVSLRMDNYVLIMAPAILLAAVFTALWGRFYDKKGFTASIIPSGILLCAGYVVLYFFRATVPVFIGSLLMMCGYLSGMAVFGAVIRDHTPLGRVGMFQGLRIVGQVLIPGVIGPALGEWVLRNAEKVVNDDGTSSFIPNRNIFAMALLAAVVMGLFLIYVCMEMNKRRRKNEEA